MAARMQHRLKTAIRRNDMVEVISGAEKGKRGRVLKIQDGGRKAVVEGVNMRFKHLRRSQENPNGGRIERESPLVISNLQLFCASCQRGVRIGKRMENEKKVRVCRKCGEPVG